MFRRLPATPAKPQQLSLAETTNLFNYEAINREVRQGTLDNKPYASKPNIYSAFIDFQRIDVPQEDLGWKLHISLADEGDNISKAWNLTVPILIKHGIETAKVLKANTALPEYQLGKEITIYDQTKAVSWSELLHEITKSYISSDIRPGYKAITDKQVIGSVYFSFRNERDSERRYIPGIIAQSYNVTNERHHFEQLKIDSSLVQLQKPHFPNELNVIAFYRMLHDIIISYSRFKIYEAFNRVDFNKIPITGELLHVVRNDYQIQPDDFHKLQELVEEFARLADIYEEGRLGIHRTREDEFRAIYISYEAQSLNFKNRLDRQLPEIMENISLAEAALSTTSAATAAAAATTLSAEESPTGSVVEKSGEVSPLFGDSGQESPHKESSSSSHIHEQLQANPSISRISSGQDRKIQVIANETSIDEDQLQQLTEQQLNNVFSLIEPNLRGLLGEKIVSGLKSRELQLAQIKNISPQIAGALISSLGHKIYSPKLTLPTIMEELDRIQTSSPTTLSASAAAAASIPTASYLSKQKK